MVNDPNNLALLVSIIGAFGLVALGINGFFLRGIYMQLSRIEIANAVTEEKFNNLKEKLENHSKFNHGMNKRVTELEKKMNQ